MLALLSQKKYFYLIDLLYIVCYFQFEGLLIMKIFHTNYCSYINKHLFEPYLNNSRFADIYRFKLFFMFDMGSLPQKFVPLLF